MLMRTDPLREFDRLTQQVFGTASRPAAVPMIAYRQGDTFHVTFDLPGIRRDTIDITVEQNVLTVQAEREMPEPDQVVELIAAEPPVGRFTRRVFLGETLDTERIQADYEGGVLALQIPVHESAKPRKVDVGGEDTRQRITT
jgi:HSP20 family protein